MGDQNHCGGIKSNWRIATRCMLFRLIVPWLLVLSSAFTHAVSDRFPSSEIELFRSPSLGADRLAEKAGEIPTYYFWMGEASEARKPFERALMRLIFELSDEHFGPARLILSEWKISSKRAMKLMKEGKVLHLQNAPFLLPELDPDAVITLPHPLFNNLLGYRELIIRKESATRFDAIEDFDDFAELVAGQGPGWADSKVYRASGIRVKEGPSFYGMFPMLAHRRFDYIPLGVSEARSTIAQSGISHHDFTVAETVMVYYPWPFNMLVSKKHPQLAERLSFGFEQAVASGAYQALFEQHFSDELERLRDKRGLLFILPTPHLPDGSQHAPALVTQMKRITAP